MNNKITSQRFTTFFPIIWLVIATITAFLLFFDFGYGYLFPVILCSLLIIITLLYGIGGFYYVDINVDNSVLNLKNYNLFPLGRKYKMYRIPINRLSNVKVKKYLGGLFSFINIYERSKKGESKYPAVGISAMTASQRKQLITSIRSLLKE